MKTALRVVLACLLLSGISAPIRGSADSAHDFDFEVGTWTISGKHLVGPFSANPHWVALTGELHRVRKIWDGRASLAELELTKPAPTFAGSLLRLYDPSAGQWNVYWANGDDGSVDPPLAGNFTNGRGVFFGQATVSGRAVYVRVVYSDITAQSFRVEQSLSTDGGASWQPNLVQAFTRRTGLLPSAPVAAQPHQHDFDFEFGSWNVQLKRLVKPLSGSHTWVTLSGTSVVNGVWDGRANIGELNASNPSSAIQGLSLRLFNAKSQQWSVYFANSRYGRLGNPMIGRFTNGRGEFYDQEDFNGRAIFVRFIFDHVSRSAFRLVQSFSADGGATWEPNWIATFSLVRGGAG